MHNRNAACIGIVFTDLFNDSVALRWIKELIFHPNNPMEFYEKKLFVSRSTLIRMIPKMNRFLNEQKMKISCKNNRYEFLGENERFLRDFSATFLLELYGLDLEKYDVEIDLGLLHRLITSTVSNNVDSRISAWALGDDVFIVYWFMFFIVSFARENQGYVLHTPHYHQEKVDAKDLLSIQKSFPGISKDHIQTIEQLMLNNLDGWDSPEEKDLVASETDLFYQRIFTDLPAPSDENTQYVLNFVLKSLYLSTKSRPYKTSSLFDRIHYFSIAAKRSKLLFYEIVQTNLAIFSDKVNLNMMSRVEDVVFWACSAYPELCSFVPSKTALLINNFGTHHTEFLKNIISDFFNRKNSNYLHLDISNPSVPLVTDDIAKYDVVVTTIPNLPISNHNVVLINDYPNYMDLFSIYKILSD